MAKKTRGNKKAGKNKPHGSRVSSEAEQITSEQALAFIRKMQKKFPKPPLTNDEKAALQDYLAQFTDGELKAVGSRVQKDLMLRPPRTIEPGGLRRRRQHDVRPGLIRKRK